FHHSCPGTRCCRPCSIFQMNSVHVRPRAWPRGHAAGPHFHHFVFCDDVLECMPMMARPKQELATATSSPQRLLWNKCDSFVVLLARRGNVDEPAKRHSAPDTSGISRSSLWRSSTMPILSRRTVAALTASFSLLAALGFTVPRATADSTGIAQAL